MTLSASASPGPHEAKGGAGYGSDPRTIRALAPGVRSRLPPSFSPKAPNITTRSRRQGAWRASLGSLFSNPKAVRYALSNWNVAPGQLTFMIPNVPAGSHTARIQYKFSSGNWQMSTNLLAAETYNSLIVLVQ